MLISFENSPPIFPGVSARRMVAIILALFGLLSLALCDAKPRSKAPLNALAMESEVTTSFQKPPTFQWENVLSTERIGPVVTLGTLWVTALQGKAEGQPCTISAFDWVTGQPVWSTPLPEGLTSVGLAAIAANGDSISDLLVTLPEGALTRLKGASGKPLWANAINAVPKEPGGLETASIITSQGVVSISPSATVYLTDLNSGKTLWESVLPRSGDPSWPLLPLSKTSLAANQDQLLVTSQDGGVFALDLTKKGNLQWQSNVSGPLRESQWLNQHWVVLGDNGLLTTLNPANGKADWSLISLDGQPLTGQSVLLETPKGPQVIAGSLTGQVLIANARSGIRAQGSLSRLPVGLTSGWKALADGGLLGTSTDGNLIAYDTPKLQEPASFRSMRRPSSKASYASKAVEPSLIRWSVPLQHRVLEAPLLEKINGETWLLTTSADGTVQAFAWKPSSTEGNESPALNDVSDHAP